MKLNARSRRGLGVLAGVAVVLPLVAGQGCPGGAGFPLPSGLLVSVISPRFDQTVSDGGLVTVVYDATSTVSGRVQVSVFYDADGVAGTGDEQYFAQNLASGTNKFIQMATADMAPGTWYVGVTASDATGAEDTAYGAGRVMILATAAMTFNSPNRDMTLGMGVLLPIRLDAGSDVRSFTWRLFYDADGAFDGNEITIAEGTNSNSSRVTRDWDTSSLAPGITYYIGATVVTADGTAKNTYAGGAMTITTGAFLEFLAPTGSLVIEAGTPLPIVVAAGDPSAATPQVRFFYDDDTSLQNGYIAAIDLVPATAGGTVWYPPMELPAGRYFIGAELVGGSSGLVSYAAGAIQILGEGEVYEGGEGQDGSGRTAQGTLVLTMRTPFRDQMLFSGEQYTIRWTTNLKLGEGTISLFREPDINNDGEPDGEETRVTIGPAGLDASTKSYTFDTTRVVGKYYIGATVKPKVGQAEEDYGEGALTMIPSVFWVGDLRTLKPKEKPSTQRMFMKGALFQGHNLRDNLGSAMLLVDDYDGGVIPCCTIGPFDENNCCTICGLPKCGTDAVCPGVEEIGGVREILFAAQFGKPWFAAQGGRGAGEAYMIYGDAGRRYLGTYEVNSVGSSRLPGILFAGIIPNPHPANTEWGLAGNSVPYTPKGETAEPFSSEGLRSVTLIPDQDGDGKMEIVFGFPYCNSYSLWYQALDGTHPSPRPGVGRLENNGHFLRGGVVILGSTTPMMGNPNALSRHFDRTIMLQEVGQVFTAMRYWDTPAGDFNNPAVQNFCPKCAPDDKIKRAKEDPGIDDTAFFPGEGFYQDTLTQTSFPLFGLGYTCAGKGMDPPRLATPEPANELTYMLDSNGRPAPVDPELALMIAFGEEVSLAQIDPPPGPTRVDFVGGRYLDYACYSEFTNGAGEMIHPYGHWPVGSAIMRVLGTGFYYDRLPKLGDPTCGPTAWLEPYQEYCPSERMANALEPFGCRILGQTTEQLFSTPRLYADRFGASVSVSGDFLLIGAPGRTARKADVTALRNDPMLGDRPGSGTVYVLQLKRPGVPADKYLWNSMGGSSTDDQGNTTYDDNSTAPAPHQYVIQDVGYSRCWGGYNSKYLDPGDVAFEISRPNHIVGMNNDHIGEVTGLPDINNDGVPDMAIGGVGTSGSQGAVYVIYRRQPEVEGDYLLERIQLAPNEPDRLVGLMIRGREGEQLGSSIAGIGPRPGTINDDYNDDGHPDMIIGSPNATPGSGYHAGEVFILFGGRTLVSPTGGITIPELRDAGEGMVLAGVRAGDRTGETVAPAGDVNHDGIADLLIAAPDASPRFDSDRDGTADTIGLDMNGDRRADDLDGDGMADDMTGAGLVYVVFGGEHLRGTIGLDQIGTANLPGLVFVGRKGGDHLGGGQTQNGLLARGVNTAGDLDGDGRDDILLSSILADPDGKIDAGEIYLIYGFSTPIQPANQN